MTQTLGEQREYFLSLPGFLFLPGLEPHLQNQNLYNSGRIERTLPTATKILLIATYLHKYVGDTEDKKRMAGDRRQRKSTRLRFIFFFVYLISTFSFFFSIFSLVGGTVEYIWREKRLPEGLAFGGQTGL